MFWNDHLQLALSSFGCIGLLNVQAGGLIEDTIINAQAGAAMTEYDSMLTVALPTVKCACNGRREM